MKRWIHASEEANDNSEWSPYSKGKYCVSGGYTLKYTNNPQTAISYWFRFQKKIPAMYQYLVLQENRLSNFAKQLHQNC